MNKWEKVKQAIYTLFFFREPKQKPKIVFSDRKNSRAVCTLVIAFGAELLQGTSATIDRVNRGCTEEHRATALESLYASLIQSAMLIADELPPENLDAVIKALEPAYTPDGVLIC